MRGSRRRILLIALALLAVGVPATVAAFSVGAGRLDNDRAQSSQDSNADGTSNLQCPSGYYAYSVSVLPTTWGTYPSITQVYLYCKSPSGRTASRSWGKFEGGVTFPQFEMQQCGRSDGAMSGLKVAYDRYIKDVQLRCGGITESGGSVRVDNRGYSGDWLTDRVQNNDTKVNLVCDPTGSVADTVVSGLRLRYKEDNDEMALTSVRIYCARVS